MWWKKRRQRRHQLRVQQMEDHITRMEVELGIVNSYGVDERGKVIPDPVSDKPKKIHASWYDSETNSIHSE